MVDRITKRLICGNVFQTIIFKYLLKSSTIVAAALCLFSAGNIGFGYVIFNELVLKCCAGYPQYL